MAVFWIRGPGNNDVYHPVYTYLYLWQQMAAVCKWACMRSLPDFHDWTTRHVGSDESFWQYELKTRIHGRGTGSNMKWTSACLPYSWHQPKQVHLLPRVLFLSSTFFPFFHTQKLTRLMVLQTTHFLHIEAKCGPLGGEGGGAVLGLI